MVVPLTYFIDKSFWQLLRKFNCLSLKNVQNDHSYLFYKCYFLWFLFVFVFLF